MTSQSHLQPLAVWDAPTLAKAVAAALVVITLSFLFSRRRSESKSPLPPGPPPIPLIGNLLDLPPVDGAPWLKWSEWAETYGDVVHIEALGQHIIVLSSAEACDDLLAKRGAIYSDRPDFTMAKLSGWGRAIGLESHNDTFRAMRRLYTPLTSPRQVLSFLPLVEGATHEFLRKISTSPDGSAVNERLRWLTGGNILKMVYGYTIKDKDDPFIRHADLTGKSLSQSTSPGWLVDMVPFLRHLPLWTPGATFLRQAAVWKKQVDTMFDGPFDLFTQKMVTGDYPSDCMIAKQLEQNPDPGMEAIIRNGLGIIYGAGLETTVYTKEVFFLAMTLHPDIQRRAQAELDSVTGGTRLPSYEDRPNLPYINAIVKEVMRWNPVTPAGIPHTCRTEDVYRGWRIPAGTMVLANIWHLTHDPARYANPTSFTPERFLGPNPDPDPTSAVFGFGRRLCPGSHLADMSIFLTVANTLATFNICKQLDQNGVEIVPEVRFGGGTVSHPLPFPFKVVPRSRKTLALLDSVY